MGFLQIHRAGHLSLEMCVVSNGGSHLGIAFRLQGGEKLRLRGALITSYNDSARGTHFRAGASRGWVSHCGKRRVHFRGGCNRASAFRKKQAEGRRATNNRDDSLRRATGGGNASAGLSDTFPTLTDCDIHDQRFAAVPARRNATVNRSHAMAECDAAEFLIKCGGAISGGEACPWQTRLCFQSLRSKRRLRRCDGLPIG